MKKLTLSLILTMSIITIVKSQDMFFNIPSKASELPTLEQIKKLSELEFTRIDLGIAYCNAKNIKQEKKEAIYKAFKKAYSGCFSYEVEYDDFLQIKNDETKRELLKTCIEKKLYDVAFLMLDLYKIKVSVDDANK